MTPPAKPNDEARVDTWFARQHEGMDADLASALDLETGLHEILLAGQHRDMGSTLADALDLDAGLAAILPHHKQHLPAPTTFDSFTDLLDWLSAVPMVRLTHRNQLRLLAIDSKILHLAFTRHLDRDLTLDLTRARDLTLARDLILALNHDRDLTRARDRALSRARDLTLTLDLNLTRDLDRDLTLALDLALDLTRDITRDITLTRDITRDITRDLDLDLALTRARDLTCYITHILTRARARGLLRGRSLTRARDLARDQTHDLVQTLSGMLVTVEVQGLLCAISGRGAVDMSWLAPATIGPRETDRLNKLVVDFTGVDLREATLSGLDLVGVRWSRTTRWPPADVDWIVAASESVGAGIYVIQGSSASGGVTVAPDPVSV